MDKLKVFPEAEHPFEGFPLVPFVPPPRRLQDRGLGWPMPQVSDVPARSRVAVQPSSRL
jgi:hypothetical protein